MLSYLVYVMVWHFDNVFVYMRRSDEGLSMAYLYNIYIPGSATIEL